MRRMRLFEKSLEMDAWSQREFAEGASSEWEIVSIEEEYLSYIAAH